jgi:Uma2 family endonuclease
VEVLSEGNTAAEMRRKRQEYFDAGVRLVWIVNLTARIVEVHTGIDESITVREGQSLDGGVVLPGFALDLTALFAEVDRGEG